jgi:dephospho-CoA kinase
VTPPLRVALTGGIATGKSRVLRRLAALGVPTIDADELARLVVRSGEPAWRAIRARFGPDVFGPDGEVDRRRLGELVFADNEARRDLETIVHPEVYAAVQVWFETLEPDAGGFAVADIPLLFETDHQSDFDRVIVTACPRDEQHRRLMDRDNLSAAEASRRIASQLPTEVKVAAADFVIRTDGAVQETDRQVDDLVSRLSAEAKALKSG